MVGNTYNNIGSTLHNMNLISEARTYYLKAIQTNKDANNVIQLGTNYSNLSECELTENNFAKAHEYNDESIKIFESYSDNYNIVGSLNVKADIFIKEKKYKNGLNVLLYSLSFAEKTGSPLVKQRTYIKIAEAFELVDDYKQATRFYKKYNVTRDSIINSEIRENVTKKQLTFEFDKKRLSDSIETISKEKYLKQEIEISKKSVKQQKYITYISLISLIIVTLLAFFIYKGYKKNKLANVIIENQKKIAEQKNKEILDSINYASRIQKASLPNDKYIDRKIKDLNKNKKL
jgi:tetratricopeptide (TPR) repeat protein